MSEERDRKEEYREELHGWWWTYKGRPVGKWAEQDESKETKEPCAN